ncbi:unnamed protein product, partial [Musa hybrid cultivar]
SRDLLVEGGSLIEEGPRKWSRSFDRTTLKSASSLVCISLLPFTLLQTFLHALVPYYLCCTTLRIRLQVKLFKFRSFRTKVLSKSTF